MNVVFNQKRMADLLSHQNPSVREVTCLALTTIAGLSDGKTAIINNRLIVDNLILLLEDTEADVRIKAASLLEMLAATWMSMY